MKHFCTVFSLVFFTSSFCFAQNSGDSIFHINKIPPEGVVLDKGWKFHTGDNPEWAKPEFNDKDWEPINPTLDIRHIPQLQKTSVYWFRLTLHVDSALWDNPFGIILSQVGASEIYLDGKLLYKFGEINLKNNRISTYYLLHDPYVIKLNSTSKQVLAVRYAYDPKSFLVKIGNPSFCFNAVLNTYASSFSNFELDVRRSVTYEISIMSAWLLLMGISFCFYLLYKSQRAYLHLTIASFLLFCWRFIGAEVTLMLSTTESISMARFISGILAMVANIFGLNGFYLIFGQKKTWSYYFIILLSLFATASFIFLYDIGDLMHLLFFIFWGIEFGRASIVAIRRKRPGASILFTTDVLWFVAQIIMIVSLVYGSIEVAYFFVFLTPIISAIGWSLFIAFEFARTGRALQARVREVEELSQEKHQILSEQNVMLEKQVEQRTTSLNKSLQELKSAQAQLIQSEKMASLGEMTAGIAHEIQNPLNFVNNFSEVNKELIGEMKAEIEKGNFDDVKSIAKDIEDNQEKINHHGKRADAIVKGMLQHSRSSSGVKEPTDMNALADEYLRLAYQGLRARDKSFNADLKTDFDNSIGKINVVPQEIGRVILNLLNNAFYAVSEKKKQQPIGYEPRVSITTRKVNGNVEIAVNDNGNGIPKKVADKIFQPFFTTKPTGQGTGLGLSLAYDIVKAHGAELKVETKEGEGAEFIIQLPIKENI